MPIVFARLLSTLFLLSLFVFAARADEVDDYVRAVLAERHIPGTAIAVVKNGRLVKAQGYGVASVEFDVPVTTETVFEIGSVSKQMTAAAVLLLVEEGKVSLDEKISKYLANLPDSWKDVTIRHLLTHTSGIRNYTGLPGFELSRRLKRDEFIKTLSTHPLDFATGERYAYSNSGYNLLGFIIESASGRPFWDFMRERLFLPLKMTKTGDRDPRFVIKNRATGYEWTNGALAGRDYDLTDVFAAGAVTSTVLDLVKWDAAWRGDALLKKETKAAAWTPVTLNDKTTYPYGFGWRLSDLRGRRLIAHSGQTAGFGASISRFTDDDLTVIALTNLGEIGMGTLIAQGVAKIYLPAVSLKALKAAEDARPELSGKVKAALAARMENKIDAELFAAELARALATERAKAAARRVGGFGAVEKLTFVGSETVSGRTIHRYLAKTPKRLFLWRFVFDSEGKIAEMTLEEEE